MKTAMTKLLENRPIPGAHNPEIPERTLSTICHLLINRGLPHADLAEQSMGGLTNEAVKELIRSGFFNDWGTTCWDLCNSEDPTGETFAEVLGESKSPRAIQERVRQRQEETDRIREDVQNRRRTESSQGSDNLSPRAGNSPEQPISIPRKANQRGF